MPLSTTFALVLGMNAATPACAPVAEVRFYEGAPVDRFVLTNLTGMDLPADALVLDLVPSRGKLIFDTTSGGAGVEVFQPFRSDVTEVSVQDGAEGLRMPLDGLAAGASVSFTIDVDDRLTASDLGQIRVSGSEMEGALVMLDQNGVQLNGTFDAANRAVLSAGCGSNS